MTFRRLLNVVYAVLVEGRKGDPDSIAALDRQLGAKFDYEMTKEERRREEARRMAEASGAIQGQQQLMASMDKGQAMEAFRRQQAQQAMGKT